MVATSRRSRKKSPLVLPARRGNVGLLVVIAGLVVVNLYVFLWRDGTSIADIKGTTPPAPASAAIAGPGLEPGAPGGDDLGPTGPVSPADEGPAEAAAVAITGAVTKNDSLGGILKREGLTAAESDELLRALAPVLDFRKLREGMTYTIERGPDGAISSFELVISKLQTVRAVRDPAGKLVGVADKAQTRIEIAELSGTIDSSLWAAVKATGEDTALVGAFVDVFAYDIDFYNDSHDGDEFRVLVEKEYKDQELLRFGRIVAAEYKGKAGTHRVFWWKPDAGGKGRYYDERGRAIERSMLKTPLKYTRISSGFDRRRMHPVLHTVRAHLGMDYAAPIGTPVWAAADGRIVSRGPAGGAGNMVVISHDAGIATVYMHLSKFARGQKVGDRVAAKTVIGYVGTTGLSTGPHLHFGVKKNGAFVDPSKLVPVRAGGVAKKDMAEFRADVDALAARLGALPARMPPPVTGIAADPATAAATGPEPLDP
jgi:murein DD-endopeptidase MepM/ murein hydrolase activator NlpD